MSLNVLQVIPARAGSKGIPRKNTAVVCGKPLIHWTMSQAMRAAQKRKNVHAIVATDDAHIHRICAGVDMDYIELPKTVTGDDSLLEPVIAMAINKWELSSQAKVDVAMILQPTSPLRLSGHILGALDLLETSGADSVFSGVICHKHLWASTMTPLRCGFMMPVPRLYGQNLRIPRQQQASRWAENGAIYAFRLDGFKGSRFFGKIACYEMPNWTAYEVDTPWDLELVRMILGMRLENGSDGVQI